MSKTRIAVIVVWMGGIALLAACGFPSRERALEETIAALNDQLEASPRESAASQTPSADEANQCLPARDLKKQFIGMTYPPYPTRWKYGGGAVTYDTCTSGARCSADEESYGVSLWIQADAPDSTAERMLWFEKVTGYSLEGSPVKLVLDILVWSEIEGDSRWLWRSCRIGGEPDYEIIVQYEADLDPPSRAWRANHITELFESVPTEGMVCMEEEAAR